MSNPKTDDNNKRDLKQPAQEDGTYPEGLEQEREQPAEGNDKPRPSDTDAKRIQ